MVRVAIYGSGASGGFIGAMLAKTDADIALIARGLHLEAMQQHGLTLIKDGHSSTVPVRATNNPGELGVQDYVIVALKAHSIPAITESIQPLLGKNTAVVFAVNGVPWWYFYRHGGKFDHKQLQTVDPNGHIWKQISPERAIGAVIYPATEIDSPGVIRHIDGNRISLGEPDSTITERCKTLSTLLKSAGFKAPVRPHIREEIWVKLLGNCSLNPISALTGSTLDILCQDPSTLAIIRDIMLEAEAVAEAVGIRLPVDIERRLKGAEAVGRHKTSMLQDLEKGRMMEIDALVAAVAEIAALANVNTPVLNMILSLVRRRGFEAGCYSYPAERMEI